MKFALLRCSCCALFRDAKCEVGMRNEAVQQLIRQVDAILERLVLNGKAAKAESESINDLPKLSRIGCRVKI